MFTFQNNDVGWKEVELDSVPSLCYLVVWLIHWRLLTKLDCINTSSVWQKYTSDTCSLPEIQIDDHLNTRDLGVGTSCLSATQMVVTFIDLSFPLVFLRAASDSVRYHANGIRFTGFINTTGQKQAKIVTYNITDHVNILTSLHDTPKPQEESWLPKTHCEFDCPIQNWGEPVL